MGKVDAFAIEGLTVFFYSSDHRPPHIHIKKVGEWEMRVYFITSTEDELDYEIKWPKTSGGPRRKVIGEILEQVLAHKAELLE
ncbi:MAG: DUF4160 domain-containing protein, partial [Bradymonadaceae bacterium]